jgi:hypothetical protein
MMRAVVLAFVAPCLLAGCASQQSTTSAPASATPYGAPPEPVGGRWMFGAVGGPPPCVMTFGAAPGAGEGTIAPEGGCPGKFYMSRKWTYDQTGLTMRDHNGQPLAQLSSAGGRFDGKATAGEAVALSR